MSIKWINNVLLYRRKMRLNLVLKRKNAKEPMKITALTLKT